MPSDPLFLFGLQHAVTGMVLYTLRAFPSEIDKANHNLRRRATEYRFVRIDEPTQPLPVARA